ncbi:MAG: carbohydrate binding family 9 domain-containing protein [Ignavibacteriales bacterium]|nr:carbohydrate binding family 9 domain-containing protein [Ignavibacteriales bacterium]
MKTFLFLFLIITVFISSTAFCTDIVPPKYRPVINIAKANDEIKVDGNLNDPVWKIANWITHFVETYPGDNTTPDVQTEAALIYDENNLYIAFNCKDDPGAIRATMSQRDQFNNDDAVAISIDTYGNASWAYEFFVNPYGVQKDYLWSSIAGSDPGFDVIWESAAHQTESGYQVEIAIPFKSLRFPNNDIQTWKINFGRIHPRESSKNYSWAANDRNEKCEPCQWGTLTGISGVQPGKGIEILPAMVAHQSGSLSNMRDPTSSFSEKKIKGEVSIGAKYSITSDVTAEAAYNPDFSQIEADAAQIDVNSTISLMYPERRPFFQEGSDIFRTMFNSFYTRTVNDPRVTAKLTGRVGNTSVAYLMAQDENTPYIIPLDEMNLMVNSGKSLVNVIRAIHTVGEDSRVGVMVGDRRFTKNGFGTVLSFDGDIRLSNNYSWLGQIIQTYSKEPIDPSLTNDFDGITFGRGKHTAIFDGESFNGTALITELRRNARNWNFVIDYNQIHPLYRTEIGYDPVVNHRTGSIYTGYTFYPENSIFTQITPQGNVLSRWSFDGIKKIERINLGGYIGLKFAQTNINFNFGQGSELFNEVMFKNLWRVSANIGSRFSSMIGLNIGANYGKGIAYWAMSKGNQTGLSATLNIKPIDRLTIDQSVNYSKSTDIETGEEFFKGYITRTRFQFQFNKEFSLRLVGQFNDFNKKWDIDPLVTYRLSPFSVLYVGSTYDYQHYDANDMHESTWKISSRQYFMKLQYLFQI